jgi:16S rRNA (adenine1518-N6/adenine1519-N6)-dimethyltransferase
MAKNILDQVKEICKLYDIKPSKSKGQNFLINPEILEVMIKDADVNKTDTVLEIGPGLGILTEELVKKAGKVFSVELDKVLVPFLEAKFKGVNNLQLFSADILAVDLLNKYPPFLNLPKDYKIVANLPYNISAKFFKKFLDSSARPRSITVLLQKEVAERICAPQGQLSLLAISVQIYGEPRVVSIVPKENFWPKPDVTSAVLTVDKIKDQNQVDKFFGKLDQKLFWQVVKIGFSAKRKQLHNNLASGFKLSTEDAKKMLNQAEINESSRAQELSIDQWKRLAEIITNSK